jgi:hypothetical protein
MAVILYGIYEGNPTIWNGAGWWFINGAWHTISTGEAAMNALPFAGGKAEFDQTFPDLPPMPKNAFQSDESLGAFEEHDTPFVDPWSKEPNHQGAVPADALFVGAWNNYVFIDTVNDALFLTRDDRRDMLWSLTTWSEDDTKKSLAARTSGDPIWMGPKLACGCVAGAPREGSVSEAATRLVDALVRAKAHFESPRPPYLPGLLTTDELSKIVGAVADELQHNRSTAKAAQHGHEAPIIELARELGLNPRPAGHNATAWMADCPRRTHTIMISLPSGQFGCGYCRRNGGTAELQAFADEIRSPRGKP